MNVSSSRIMFVLTKGRDTPMNGYTSVAWICRVYATGVGKAGKAGGVVPPRSSASKGTVLYCTQPHRSNALAYPGEQFQRGRNRRFCDGVKDNLTREAFGLCI